VADLASNLRSPDVIASIDEVVSDLLDLRKIAVSIHGDPQQMPPVSAPATLADESLNAKSPAFDGTVDALIDEYLTHPESSYLQIGYTSRENYKFFLRPIQESFGGEQIKNLDAERIKKAHAVWSSNDRIAMAFGVVSALGRLATFGDTVLKDRDCRELRITLHDLDFPRPKVRDKKFTREMADLIRVAANRKGMASLALAQAFQFELGLSQKDVIGEWVPIEERGTSELTFEGKKWVRGIRWNEIENWMLRRDGKEFNLKWKPMVMEELASYKNDLPSSGPIIIYEATGRPYSAVQFRHLWRQTADECGIDKHIRNQDSRAAIKDEANEKVSQASSA